MVPARVRREPSVLSAAQVTQLLDATRDDPHHALWAVLTLTGLRPSEALVRHRDRQEVERLTRPATPRTISCLPMGRGSRGEPMGSISIIGCRHWPG